MAYEKMILLIKRLHDSTLSGRQTWDETVEEGEFQAAFPGFTVRLSKSDRSGSVDYLLSIFNENARLLEQVSDVDLGQEFENSFQVMEHLYESARQNAMGVQEALDRILAELPPGDDEVPF